MEIVRWGASISRYRSRGSAITIWQLSDRRWSRCVQVDARNATIDELQTAHDEEYIEKVQKSSSTDVRTLPSDHESPLNVTKEAYESALRATGSVIEVRLFAMNTYFNVCIHVFNYTANCLCFIAISNFSSWGLQHYVAVWQADCDVHNHLILHQAVVGVHVVVAGLHEHQ